MNNAAQGGGCPFGYDKLGQKPTSTNINNTSQTINEIQTQQNKANASCPVGAVTTQKAESTPSKPSQGMQQMRDALGQFIGALQEVINGVNQMTEAETIAPQQGVKISHALSEINTVLKQYYNQMGQTTNPAQTTHQHIDKNIDFTQLSSDERTQIGLNDRDRAILHLWGRQVITDGHQDGSIYATVLGEDGTGNGWPNKEEVALVKELQALDRQQFGTDTGTSLDQEFFALYQRLTGINLEQRYANRAVKASNGALEITNDLQQITQQTGLTESDQAVLRFIGHDPLMDGKLNGSILDYTIGNNNALDGQKHSEGNAIDGHANALIEQDLRDDGLRNGSSLAMSSLDVLDKIYGLK